MLAKLKVENFLPYADTEVTFDSGLNVIVGADTRSTDTGKSAFYKAITKVLMNDPKGQEIIKRGTNGPCIIEATLTDNTIIEYKLEGSKHNWKLIRPDGSERNWPTAAQPDEIQQILQLTELNFQKQEDVYFLLNNTPGKTAQIINEAAGLGIIAKAIKYTQSLERDEKKHLQKVSEQLIEVQETLGVLKEVEDILELKEIVEETIKDYQQKQKDVSKLKSTLQQLEVIQIKLQLFQNLGKLRQQAKEISDDYTKQKNLVIRIVAIRKLLKKLNNTKKTINALKLLDKTNVSEDIEEILLQVKQIKKQIIDIRRLTFNITQCKKKKEELNTEYNKIDGIKNSLVTQLKRLLSHCPICGQKLETEILKEKVRKAL